MQIKRFYQCCLAQFVSFVMCRIIIKKNNYIFLFIIYILLIYIMWAISKTLGSRKGHPQIWEGPIAYHTFVQ